MAYLVEIVVSSVSAEYVKDDTYLVTCVDADGRQYSHFHVFSQNDYRKAKALADRVREAGKIDLTHWDCYVPYGSDAWLIDGMEVTLMDDEERYFKGL